MRDIICCHCVSFKKRQSLANYHASMQHFFFQEKLIRSHIGEKHGWQHWNVCTSRQTLLEIPARTRKGCEHTKHTQYYFLVLFFNYLNLDLLVSIILFSLFPNIVEIFIEAVLMHCCYVHNQCLCCFDFHTSPQIYVINSICPVSCSSQ